VSVHPRLVFGDDPDDLGEILGQLQSIVVRYPIAAQAAFRALVAEGRAFAETEEGRELARSLADSRLVRRGRIAWDVVTARAFDDDPDVIVPSVFLDALARSAAVDALEPLLSRLFEQVSENAGESEASEGDDGAR
jgi:hypothetical protein